MREFLTEDVAKGRDGIQEISRAVDSNGR